MLSACNISNEGSADIGANDAIKINPNSTVKNNTNDAIKANSSDNALVKVSNNKALECHNTIPDWQIKELAQVPCLTLPISNQDFLDIPLWQDSCHP